MKIKKRVAGFLATIMLVNATSIMGNVQDRLPLDGIEPIVVTHTANTSTGDILPSAQIAFKRATNSESTGGYNDKTEAQFYELELQDVFGNVIKGNRFQAIANQEIYVKKVEEHIEDVNKFRNGTLYKISVKPGHTHEDEKGNQFDAPLSTTSNDPVKYFLTDFNTIMKEVDDEIQVSWEYVPGATYKLVYIDKDVSTKEGVDGTDNSVQTGVGTQSIVLTEDEVETFSEKGIKKVRYTLPNTIPGQKYSAYVMVESLSNSFLKDKWENVGRNITTPKIAQASRSVNLKISNIGRNRIKLKWQLGAWADNNKLKTTKIYRKTEGEIGYTLIGTIYNASLIPRDPGEFEHDEPTGKSYYYVEYIFTGANGDEVLKTKEVEYIPYILREQPLRPQVPKPYMDSLVENEDFNKSDYLVTGDDVAVDVMKDNTFHMLNNNPLQLQLVWDAPKEADGSIEHNMKYDIWVVDDEESLSDEAIEPIISDLSIDAGASSNLIYKQDNKTIIGFKTILENYTNSKGLVSKLISNETYYIKIVAKRNYSGEYSISQPTVVAITVDKNGDIFTPPVLAKPPLRIQKDGIATDSITIEWLEKWHEITANDAEIYTDKEEQEVAKQWNSKVYTGGTPAISFKPSPNLKEHVLMTSSDVEVVRKIVGKHYDTYYRDREVKLGSNIQYEVKSIPYDDVIKQIKKETGASIATSSSITLQNWLVDKESNSVDGWKTITPGDVDHGDNLPWLDYTVPGLQPNTRYIILIRAYRVLDSGTKLRQTFPSYVIGTTKTEYESPEAAPMVPVLNANGVSEESVSVWWTYNDDFDYEIVYSRLDDPDSAEVWEFEISNTPGDSNYVSNGSKAVVTITGLLPETTYNVWIRAKQKEGSQISSWSNPVTQTTDTIETPDVPRGLGPAAYQSILALGLDFLAVGSDYITVEWIKDVEDVEGTEDSGLTNKAYSYVLEFANNVEFLDSITVVTGGEGEAPEGVTVLDKSMVQFTGLDANKKYYVRVKTVLTFTDPETGKTIVKESEFTKKVPINTKTSSGEYDGGDNDNIVIYDTPVIETYENDIWTWHIVDNAKTITNIINSKNYYYTITLNLYKNKHDASVRRIKMDKAILDALINQSMALKVETNIGIYEIPAKSLKVYSDTYSASDIVQFDLIKGKNSDMYAYQRSYPEMFVKGERLDITFRGNNRSTQVQKLDGYAYVKLKLDTVEAYRYKDYYTYTYIYDTASWSKQNYTVETLQNSYLTFQASSLGLFAMYEKAKMTSGQMTYLMNQLMNDFNIAGLGTTYFSTDYVYRDQYIILLMNIAQNRSSINLTQSASSELIKQAKTSGIYISSNSGTITEEQAIAGLVRLYELKRGFKIKPSSQSFANVSSNYREAVRKAYAIGLIENITPQGKVTYSKLCDWVAQVIY